MKRRAGGSGLNSPYAEQLAQFKAEKGVRPRDILCEVVFTFDA